jgi:exopolyphosphatase/pppGpp-phosphohydrolase
MVATHVRERGKPPKKREALSISQAALRRMVSWLIEARVSERIRLEGVDPRREDLILPTAITLLAWMEGCQVSRLRYAEGSLREGLVVQRFLRHHERFTRRIDDMLH